MIDILDKLPEDPDELNGGQFGQVLLNECIEDPLKGIGILLLDVVQQNKGVELSGWLLRAELLRNLIGPLLDHLLVLAEQLDAAEEGSAGDSGVVAGDQGLDVATIRKAGTARSARGWMGRARGGSSSGRSS